MGDQKSGGQGDGEQGCDFEPVSVDEQAGRTRHKSGAEHSGADLKPDGMHRVFRTDTHGRLSHETRKDRRQAQADQEEPD